MNCIVAFKAATTSGLAREISIARRRRRRTIIAISHLTRTPLHHHEVRYWAARRHRIASCLGPVPVAGKDQ